MTLFTATSPVRHNSRSLSLCFRRSLLARFVATNFGGAGRIEGNACTGSPAMTADVMQFVKRKPDLGLHASPLPHCFPLLKGVLEVVITLGHTEHLDAVDIFRSDDVARSGTSVAMSATSNSPF